MNTSHSPNNSGNRQNTYKTIHSSVDKAFLDKQDELWDTESKHTRKTVLVVLGVFVAIALISGVLPFVGKLPLTPVLVIYIIYRHRKLKELKKRNHEELMAFQEQLHANRVKAGVSNTYIEEIPYEEYLARKKREEAEIEIMESELRKEEERRQRMEEEWRAQQELFQQIHGDHYD